MYQIPLTTTCQDCHTEIGMGLAERNYDIHGRELCTHCSEIASECVRMTPVDMEIPNKQYD